MADQGKWFKLWCTALRDDDLENLSVHDWYGWARLGAHIKENGRDGKIRFSAPARMLLHLLRVDTFDAAIEMIKRFPHVYVGERSSTVTPVTNATVTYDIEYQNWFKYQGDFSNDRVRKFRDKKRHAVTAQEETRRDVDKKRGEENINTLAPAPKERKVFVKPTFEEVEAYCKEIYFDLNVTAWFAHYSSNGWRVGKNPMKNWKAAIQTWKQNRNQFGGKDNASNVSKGILHPTPIARRAQELSGLRKVGDEGDAGTIFSKLRDRQMFKNTSSQSDTGRSGTDAKPMAGL